MAAGFRSWWENICKPRDAVLITLLVVLITLFVVILLGYTFHWDWTGLSQKTLWDWLQLLIIPAVLAVGGYLFYYTASKNEQRATEQRAQSERDAAEKRAQTERDIALDNQRETALQSYIDKLSELLLHEKLRESKPEDEVRKIGRVRTLTVLPRLDNERKKSVLQFLHASGLIDIGMSIIDLDGADLSKAHLRVANLYRADLRGADLSEAHLSWAKLGGADLGGANLRRANLGRANLSETHLNRADLSEGDLSKANLSGAILGGANLSEADLSRANLSGAILSGANLSEADLGGADLSEADLGGADLSGADLGGASLSGAIVTPEQLNRAISLQDAIMPDWSKHP